MASVQTSKYDGRYLKLTVEETSTSVEDNTSTLTWTLESIGGNSNYYNVYDVKVTINGTVVYGPTSKTWDSKTFPAAKGTRTGTISIEHNDDGTASDVSFTLRGAIYNNNPKNYNGTLSLSVIPRASEITVPTANIGEATTIAINKPPNTNFTTTISYKSPQDSEWIPIVTTTQDSYGWTVPTRLYAMIPNDPTIQCQFQAETISDGQTIGTTTTTATFRATGNPIIGTRTGTDINSTTANLTSGTSTSTTKMVKYASNIQVSVSATAQNSAYLSSIKVNGSNVTLDGTSTSTTRSGTIPFNGATTNVFTIVATDSRGNSTTQNISNTLQMVDYTPLTITPIISRNTPVDGKVNINVSGNYFNGNFRTNVPNTLTVQYRYKEDGGSYSNWANITITPNGNAYTGSIQVSNINYTKVYYFDVQAIDEVQTKQSLNNVVTKGQPIFYWDDDEFGVNGSLKKNGSEVALESQIPTVNNATLTIKKNNSSVGTFTANASSNKTINIEVPDDTVITGTGIVSRTSGATLNSSSYSKQLNIVQLEIVITTSGSTSAGDNCFVGTINNSNFYPKTAINSCSYNGTSGIMCYINTSGEITYRVIGSTLASGKELTVGFTYIV